MNNWIIALIVLIYVCCMVGSVYSIFRYLMDLSKREGRRYDGTESKKHVGLIEYTGEPLVGSFFVRYYNESNGEDFGLYQGDEDGMTQMVWLNEGFNKYSQSDITHYMPLEQVRDSVLIVDSNGK